MTADEPPRQEHPLTVLYIGGLGRSGSTLLERLLGEVGCACPVGELAHLWVRGLDRNERCGCGEAFRSCGFWRQVGERAVGGWDHQAVGELIDLQRGVDRNRYIPLMLAPWMWSGYHRRLTAYTRLLARVYAAIAEVSGCNLVVDSTKHASTAFLLRHVPGVDLRVVHLVRDPRGVAHSWMKKVPKPEVVDETAYMARLSPVRMSVRWVSYNLLFHLLAAVGVPTAFLRYEDLVAAPRPALARLLDLTGRSPALEDLDFLGSDVVELAEAHSVAGNPLRFRQGPLRLHTDESWRQHLPARARTVVEVLTAPLQAAYGYRQPRPDEPATADPSTWPDVSVVVATRDRPELLRRAITTILGQDYPGTVEVVVVFDQSRPDPELEQNRPQRRVRVLTNSRRPGLAGARNSGAEAARGELLAFCDDDDEWLPGKLTAQVRAVTATPGAAAVTGGIIVRHGTRAVTRIPDPAKLTHRALLRDRATAAHPSTYLVPRSTFFEHVGMVDEELPGSYAEDYDWLLRAARHGPILVVPYPVAVIHWGPTSFFADRWQTIIAAIDHLLRSHPEFAQEPRGLARLYGRKAFAAAALGNRGQARRWALDSLRCYWREPRAWIALLVSTGAVSAQTAMELAHARGRGI